MKRIIIKFSMILVLNLLSGLIVASENYSARIALPKMILPSKDTGKTISNSLLTSDDKVFVILSADNHLKDIEKQGSPTTFQVNGTSIEGGNIPFPDHSYSGKQYYIFAQPKGNSCLMRSAKAFTIQK